VGCFLNSCCYGKPTSLAIGVAAAGATRHPVPLYEAAFNLLLYLVLVRRYLRPRVGGEVFGLYLGAYGAWRFAAEFLRGDERLAWFGLTGAQWLSLGVAAAGLAVLFGRRRAAAGAGDPGHGTAHGTGR
jgi:phosphatidylglycerol:prolipoprotein diacylglycerol transferase